MPCDEDYNNINPQTYEGIFYQEQENFGDFGLEGLEDLENDADTRGEIVTDLNDIDMLTKAHEMKSLRVMMMTSLHRARIPTLYTHVIVTVMKSLRVMMMMMMMMSISIYVEEKMMLMILVCISILYVCYFGCAMMN